MSEREPLKVVKSSHLTDADWAEINKVRRAYSEGGTKAADEIFEKLARDDLNRYLAITEAFWPGQALEAWKDATANRGLTEEDLLEMKRRRESPARDQ